MLPNDDLSSAETLNKVIALLTRLLPEERERIISATSAFFEYWPDAPARPRHALSGLDSSPAALKQVPFSEDLQLSPKEFVLQKEPTTDVERAACLAYYLTHYRDTPYFKTIDISRVNTEAAQPKFANATWVVDNALKGGYFAPATRGHKQISAAGEQFVMTLPDRQAALAIMAASRRRKRPPRKAKPTSKDS